MEEDTPQQIVRKPPSPTGASWYWVLGGAAYGLAMRALLGLASSLLHDSAFGGVMSQAFLIGTPVVVGALSIAGARNPPRVDDVLLRPLVAMGLMLLGCMITLLEGSICIVILAPLFMLLAMAGGAVMGLLIHLWRWRTSHLRAIAVAPLVMLAFESPPSSLGTQEIRETVEVHAPPAVVWQQILQARDIQPDELPPSLVHAIGVPRPLAGVNLSTPQGEIRRSQWERGVNFVGRVRERRDGEYIRWEYEFNAHSFPPGTMDEHVAIGGRYFDLHDTAFELSPLAGSSTRLTIVAHYRVTSSINFYAVPAARVLGRDFVASILGLYKGRSERAVTENSEIARVAQRP